MPSPVSKGTGHRKPGGFQPDKSRPIDGNLLAQPKDPPPAWFGRPELLPRRPPTKTGRP